MMDTVDAMIRQGGATMGLDVAERLDRTGLCVVHYKDGVGVILGVAKLREMLAQALVSTHAAAGLLVSTAPGSDA